MSTESVMHQALHLSIIIPALNEAERLPEILNRIVAFTKAQSFISEIIVVTNGSINATKGSLEEDAYAIPDVITYRNDWEILLNYSRPFSEKLGVVEYLSLQLSTRQIVFLN